MYVNEGTDVTAMSEDLPGWVLTADDGTAAWSNEPAENGYDTAETRCALCGEDDPDADDVCMSPEAEDDKHQPETVEPALSWCNSAHIDLDAGREEVTVTISVGDPRGAFAMRVERIRWTNEDGDHDELRLSVPTPEMGLPHMKLTPLASPGYYRIG